MQNHSLTCTFCRKSELQVRNLVAGLESTSATNAWKRLPRNRSVRMANELIR